MDACPHCSSTSGYKRKVSFKAVRSYGWDGDVLETDQWQITSQTLARCNDCGRSVEHEIVSEKARGRG